MGHGRKFKQMRLCALISMLGRVKNSHYSSCLVGIANRHSWDVDWSQVVNLETLIGRKSAVLRRWLVRELWANHVYVRCRYFYSARSCKYEVPRSEMCVLGLYHLFSVPLILLTNAYTGCGRPTPNFVERFYFWLGSVRSASKITQNELKRTHKWTANDLTS